MKKIAGLFLTGILVIGQAQAQNFKSPDIMIDSKLDYNWSSVLFTKFRQLLENFKMTDPFVGRFPENKLMNESKIGDLLPVTSRELINDLGNAVGLEFIKGETKVWIEGLAYDVKGFQTNVKANNVLADGIVIGTDFVASEVNMAADKITFSLTIPGRNNSPVFSVQVIHPFIRAKEENLINFFAKIKVQDQKDHYKLSILDANFDKMADHMVSRPQDIDLNYEKIIIPKVSVKVGNKTINFSQEKIENYLRQNHEGLKGILLAQVADTLRSNTSHAALKVLEQYKLNKEYWIATAALQTQFEIESFNSSPNGDNIQINMPGDFCTKEKFKQMKDRCIQSKITQTAPSRITKKFHTDSIKIMKTMMEEGNGNLVASISEDYLNKLLVTTYDAGYWKTALDEAGVDLGPNKVILRMDKRGDSGTLIMDVIYKPSNMERLMVGSRIIRIPLVLDVSVRIEKHDNDPVVIIRLNEVDTSYETLINGLPKDNIISTVKDVPRFKSKVASAISAKLSSLRNKDILELRFPEFKGLGLDKVEFISDGTGRMHAIMRLEDLVP